MMIGTFAALEAQRDPGLPAREAIYQAVCCWFRCGGICSVRY